MTITMPFELAPRLRRSGRALTLTLTMLLAFLLSACGGESTTIRIAVLPIMDTLPLYVAAEQGYYEAEGVTVEFIPVGSAPERDQLIQSGQADAMVNELLSTMFYNAADVQVVTVRNARVPTPEFPHFYILASGSSDISAPADLAGIEIGVSQATIIEYGTDRMLAASGLAPEDIVTIAIPRIPDRLALLGSGELAAANMPDPLAALAVQGGARVIVDDARSPEYGGSVITFREAFVTENEAAVEGFLRAIEQAVADVNSDKAAWSGLLSERELVPPPLLDSYVIPDFPTASIPPRSQWDDMLAWATEKGYVQGAPAYETSVSDAYLP